MRFFLRQKPLQSFEASPISQKKHFTNFPFIPPSFHMRSLSGENRASRKSMPGRLTYFRRESPVSVARRQNEKLTSQSQAGDSGHDSQLLRLYLRFFDSYPPS